MKHLIYYPPFRLRDLREALFRASREKVEPQPWWLDELCFLETILYAKTAIDGDDVVLKGILIDIAKRPWKEYNYHVLADRLWDIKQDGKTERLQKHIPGICAMFAEARNREPRRMIKRWRENVIDWINEADIEIPF